MSRTPRFAHCIWRVCVFSGEGRLGKIRIRETERKTKMRKRQKFKCDCGQVMVTVSVRPCSVEREKKVALPVSANPFDPFDLQRRPITKERLAFLRDCFRRH